MRVKPYLKSYGTGKAVVSYESQVTILLVIWEYSRASLRSRYIYMGIYVSELDGQEEFLAAIACISALISRFPSYVC